MNPWREEGEQRHLHTVFLVLGDGAVERPHHQDRRRLGKIGRQHARLGDTARDGQPYPRVVPRQAIFLQQLGNGRRPVEVRDRQPENVGRGAQTMKVLLDREGDAVVGPHGLE